MHPVPEAADFDRQVAVRLPLGGQLVRSCPRAETTDADDAASVNPSAKARELRPAQGGRPQAERTRAELVHAEAPQAEPALTELNQARTIRSPTSRTTGTGPTDRSVKCRQAPDRKPRFAVDCRSETDPGSGHQDALA